MIGSFLGYFEKPHSCVKTALVTFGATFGKNWATFGNNWATFGKNWATFGNNWATFIPTSGHIGRG